MGDNAHDEARRRGYHLSIQTTRNLGDAKLAAAADGVEDFDNADNRAYEAQHGRNARNDAQDADVFFEAGNFNLTHIFHAGLNLRDGQADAAQA
nr:hypothetical protein [Tanacetum cinerariifolium]